MLAAEYELSCDPNRIDIALVHDFLRTSYWAEGRSRETVERSIRNSLCFGVYAGAQQVAFARVVTDRAVFAYLADVFVIRDYRGRGIGKGLVQAILAHPELATVQSFMLGTRDAHGLYARFGFEPIAEPQRLMSRRRPSAAACADGAPGRLP
jgi:N-acetylglutamate synthase-like GNAT family acetyltransferase